MNKSKTSLTPRKMPAQARSRATVDAIIQAATYILIEQGWEGLTTNAIAERAGVNIGSLYQFFPNKEAVIAELQRRHALASHAQLHQALGALHGQSTLREVLTQLVAMTVAGHRVAPAVHKAISDELPRALRCMGDGRAELRAQFLAVLKPHMRKVANPELAVYMMSVAAHAVIHSVTDERPELLDTPELVEELVTMLENFIAR